MSRPDLGQLEAAVAATELTMIRLERVNGWWNCTASRGMRGWSKLRGTGRTWPEALAVALDGVMGGKPAAPDETAGSEG